MRPNGCNSVGLWLVVLILVLDQASKLWVASHWQLGERYGFHGWVEITRAHNYGAAFSVLGDAGGWQRWLFVALALGACVGIGWFLLRPGQVSPLLRLGLAAIFAGALGNLIDRLAYGYVVDFILVHLGTYPFPAFNVADSAITLGAVLVIWDGLRASPPGPSR